MNLLYALLFALPAMAMAIDTLKPFNYTATVMFIEGDKNHDGFIDRQELDAIYRGYDANNNGRISRQEYTQYIQAHAPNLYQVSHALYDIYDVDNDDQLDHHDFDNFYALMDGNGDGTVSHFEYVRYWTILLEDLEQIVAGTRTVVVHP
ncbi:uncharacterized protein LOC131945953 isoform X2 [Physella acuta]|uniref:uncharacterized protein LOC131945953 isoform X2 n=1 Tax=Physella acuta TaxID=109671 RepID=UPI0027DE5238|nr:uncharacterized protein LOC131945953 isoform X2 [Physella acuta]XP_059162571.1 uncharacterized protein LOC131945953 isoform X2 [Physella acuta]